MSCIFQSISPLSLHARALALRGDRADYYDLSVLSSPQNLLDYSFIQVILRVGTDTYVYRFFGRMKGVLDALTLYSLENGLITCIATVGALAFWLVLPATTL
ncbi:hypothetical protein B0H14DRAFT_2863913 [Mycena olivaceomarginata]|nr:hypothetical protein B0H14DRAFT_2863913 [Mycena olivaceomarginata]